MSAWVWCGFIAAILVVDGLAWAGLLPIQTFSVWLWQMQRAHGWIGYALLATLIALTLHLVVLPYPWQGHQ
ncbi:MAG: hypothetical protein QJR02_07155 [Sinobacteraceae bacterium]|nr:hypothetical protein [Nevskiaceae bacterium]